MIDDVIPMLIIFSTACAIELADTVVVTGGYDTVITFDFLTTVQVYDTVGPKEQLPDLLTPRAFHACAHYVDSDNRVVSLAFLRRCIYLYIYFSAFVHRVFVRSFSVVSHLTNE